MSYVGVWGEVISCEAGYQLYEGIAGYRGKLRLKHNSKELDIFIPNDGLVLKENESLIGKAGIVLKCDDDGIGTRLGVVKIEESVGVEDIKKLKVNMMGSNLYLHSWDWKDLFRDRNFSVTPRFVTDANSKPIRCNMSKKRITYLLKGDFTVTPLLSSANIDHLSGSEKAFPIDMYYCLSEGSRGERERRDGHRLTCLGVYKDDGASKFPIEYRVRVKKIGKNRSGGYQLVKLCFHAFVDPEKWHFGVLKHKLGIEGFNRIPDTPRVCRYVLDSLRRDPELAHCDVGGCLTEGAFGRFHKKIRAFCLSYLKEAVTFWERAETILADKRRVKVHLKDKIGGDNIALLNVKAMGRIEESGMVKTRILILRGITYNAGDHEPTYHVNPVTFYTRDDGNIVGEERGYSYYVTIEKRGS